MEDFFNLKKLESDEKETIERRKTQQARDEARGLDNSFQDVEEQKYYPLIQWFTWIEKKRYLVEAGNQGETIVRLVPLKTDYWPVVESTRHQTLGSGLRLCDTPARYPTSHFSSEVQPMRI